MLLLLVVQPRKWYDLQTGHRTGEPSHTLRKGGVHITLLIVLGILGQCSPVYPYVDVSGWATVLAIAIHLLTDMEGITGLTSSDVGTSRDCPLVPTLWQSHVHDYGDHHQLRGVRSTPSCHIRCQGLCLLCSTDIQYMVLSICTW